LVDGGWHNWRMRWDEDGFQILRDYVDGRNRTSVCREAHTVPRQSHRFAVAVQHPVLAGSISLLPSVGLPAATRRRQLPGGDARRLVRVW